MGPFARHVFVCTHGEYCPADGAAEIHRLLKEGVAARGLKKQIRVNKTGCLDQCGHGPMVAIYPENVWYARVDVAGARRILEDHLIGGRPVADLVYEPGPGAHKDPARILEIEKARRAAASTPGGEPGR
jgi:(2Fe-2S) ferredoxin